MDGHKETVDRVVKIASERGKYVILDLHHYKAFNEYHVEFWMEVAELYKNNPTVLFGILNEPHSITWEQWRNGGGEKVTEGGKEYVPIGHQTVVEKIRDLGAKNIIIAGGLDWGYDLRGIVGEAEGDPKSMRLLIKAVMAINQRPAMVLYMIRIFTHGRDLPNWVKMMGTARKSIL